MIIKKFITRHILYTLYRFYGEIHYRFFLKEGRPLPPIPCQICEQPGHVELLCPKRIQMGLRGLKMIRCKISDFERVNHTLGSIKFFILSLKRELGCQVHDQSSTIITIDD